MVGYTVLPRLSQYLQLGLNAPNFGSNEELVTITASNPQLVFPILAKLLQEKNQETFLETCRWVILGGDPTKRVKELFNEGKLYTQMCSQVWGQSEIAYRCLTCGLSSASSLCVTCFQNGDHKGHNYSIYRSSFGGCCDCGNEESWKPSGNCCMHPGKTGKNPLDIIREDKTLGNERAAHVTIHILMLFLDQSITLLRASEELSMPKNTTALDSHLDKEFALNLIPWFGELAALGDPLRCIVGSELLNCCLNSPAQCHFSVDVGDEEEPLYDLITRIRNSLDDITIYDSSALLCRLSAHLPIADPLINLYLQLLYDENFKREFMHLFIKFYPSLAPFMKSIDKSSDKRIMDDFINRITAQLWNIHAQVMECISNSYNLIGTLMDTLFWTLIHAVPERSITLNCDHRAIEKDHYWSFITDTITLISYEPASAYLMKERRDLLQKWLYIVSLCMDMNPNVRQNRIHVEVESNTWRTSFTLELTISRSFRPLFIAFASNIKSLESESRGTLLSFVRNRIRMIVVRLFDIFEFNRMSTSLKSQGLPHGKEIMTILFDIGKHPISLHIPLHRMLAGFIQQAGEIDSLNVLLSCESLPKYFLECLIEHPMRIQALCAEVDANLWARNGNSLRHQIYLYRRRSSFCDDGYDYDILLLQCLSILLGPDAFVTIAVKRFQLQNIFLMPSIAGRNLEAMTIVPSVVSELLSMFVNIITHRSKCGMSAEDCIRREIVHTLAPKDLTFSQLESSICSRLTSMDNFESILNEVANHISASVCTEGCYQLKASSWEIYDPYFARYSAIERQQSQDRYHEHLKATNQVQTKGLLPPPIIYPCFKSFERIMDLMWCSSMLYIYYTVISRRNRSEFNDSSLHAVLHLLRMATDHAPLTSEISCSSEPMESNDLFPHTSFDENIRFSIQLPFGSLLDLLIKLYSANDTDKSLLVNINQILRKLAARCEKNERIIKSHINTFGDVNSQEDTSEESKRELAKQRQKEIMRQFSDAQQQFLQFSEGGEDHDIEEENLISDSSYDCVLCRDSSSLQQSLDDNRPFGLAGFLQKSNLLRFVYSHDARKKEDEIDLLSADINKSKQEEPPQEVFFTPLQKHIEGEVLKDLEHTSTNDIRFCGHYVHLDCMYRYFSSLCSRYQSGNHYEGANIINIPGGEFLCPSCRRLSNCVVPLLPKSSRMTGIHSNQPIKISQTISTLGDFPVIQQLVDWTPPEELFSEEKLNHEGEEKKPAEYSIRSKDARNQIRILPSAPIAPLLPGANHWSEALDIFLQRTSCLQSGIWIDASIRGPYAYQLYNFFELLRERLASLEIQSRDISFSFLDFVTTFEGEMLVNELLCNICLSYRSDDETCNAYRKFISHIIVKSLTTKHIEEEYEVDVLKRDPFSILLTLVGCNVLLEDFTAIFRIVGILFILNLLQSYLTIHQSTMDEYFTSGNVEMIMKHIFTPGEDESCLENHLRSLSLKFLKQSSLLLILLDKRIASNIPLCLTLGDTPQSEKDYEQLCCLLNIPTVAMETLRSPETMDLVKKWLMVRVTRSNEEKQETETPISCTFHRKNFLARQFSFVKLPHLFQEVYQHLVRQRCNVCEEATPETGICLTCGQVICAGIKHLLGRSDHKIPNSLNVFVSHSEECGGVFLVLKLSTILLFRGRRISVWHSLYLDDHGEEDIELKRGKALYLNESRVEQLLKLLLTQNFDHDTRILSKTQLLGLPNSM